MNYGSVCSGIEAATIAWRHLNWQPQWFSEIEPFCCQLLSHHYPTVPNLGDLNEINPQPPTSTSSSAAPPANPSALPASEKEWMTNVVNSPTSTPNSLARSVHDGSYGKTSPTSCMWTKGEHLEPSSGSWRNAGIISPTESSTFKTSESPNAAVACSLSDILQAGDLPQRVSLTPQSAATKIARLKKHGKKPNIFTELLTIHASAGATTQRPNSTSSVSPPSEPNSSKSASSAATNFAN